MGFPLFQSIFLKKHFDSKLLSTARSEKNKYNTFETNSVVHDKTIIGVGY